MTPLDAVAAAIRERLLAGQPAPLPGLGTLIRQHVSARIQEQPNGKRVLLPPGETVSLVPTEAGHTSLEHAFARFRGADSDASADDYNRAMDQIEGRLAAIGEAKLPGVGLLRRTSSGIVLGVEADLLAAVNRTYEGLSPVRTDASETSTQSQKTTAPAPPPPAAPAPVELPTEPPAPTSADLEDEAAHPKASHPQESDLEAEPPTPPETTSPSASSFLDDDLLDEAFDDVLPVPFGSPQSPPLSELLPDTPGDDEADDAWASETWTAPAAGPPPDLEAIDDDIDLDIEDADFEVVQPEDPTPAFEHLDPETDDFEDTDDPFDLDSIDLEGDLGVSVTPDLEDVLVEDEERPDSDLDVTGPANEPRPLVSGLEDEPEPISGLEDDRSALAALFEDDSDDEVPPLAIPAAASPAPGAMTSSEPVLVERVAPTAEPVRVRPTPSRPSERRRFPWVLAGILLLAIVAVVAFEYWPRATSDTDTPAEQEVAPLPETQTSTVLFTPDSTNGIDSLGADAAFDLEDGGGLEGVDLREDENTDILPIEPFATASSARAVDGAPATGLQAQQAARSQQPSGARTAPRSEPATRPGLGLAPQSRMAITPPVLAGLSASDRESLSGRSPVRSSADAWTFVVLSTPADAEARRLSERYRLSGYRTTVIEVESGGRAMYRVAVGQFSSRSDALRLRDRLPPQAPDDTWPLDLQTL